MPYNIDFQHKNTQHDNKNWHGLKAISIFAPNSLLRHLFTLLVLPSIAWRILELLQSEVVETLQSYTTVSETWYLRAQHDNTQLNNIQENDSQYNNIQQKGCKGQTL